MYVREIRIGKFRHIENVIIGPFPKPTSKSDVVVLAGPNGSGKSSILELLGHALSDAWSLTWQIKRSFPESSFEIALGLASEEVAMIKAAAAARPNPEPLAEIVDYLQSEAVYYRGFRYEGGEYAKDATLHNKIHSFVALVLKNENERPLGFFLRSDRAYGGHRFRREQILNVDQMQSRDHMWSMAFNTSDVQYEDMFRWLIQQRFHHDRRIGAHFRRQRSGEPFREMPEDPLGPYDELLGRLYPGYGFADGPTEVPDDLFVRLATGDVVRFADLSSGEQEVFFVLSFFLRHNVTNAVIALDEPELHLHPDFARLLVHTMRGIKSGNQVWVATHNAEIIDEAGRDRTTYILRDANHAATVVPGTDEDEAIQALRQLFGLSGYVGVARRMVFLEGSQASSDRKMFAGLFPEEGRSCKFIPSGGSEMLPRLNTAVLAILESTLSVCDFYLIRDRDYLTEAFVEKYRRQAPGRLWVLQRNQIENYLLNEVVIASVELDVFGTKRTVEEVTRLLHRVALDLSGEVLRDMVAFRLNVTYRAQDFSMGSLLQGQGVVGRDGDVLEDRVKAVEDAALAKANSATEELARVGGEDGVRAIVEDCRKAVEAALVGPGWRDLFPGKQLLREYARRQGLGKAPVFENCLIKRLADQPGEIAPELRQIMQTIVEDGTSAT